MKKYIVGFLDYRYLLKELVVKGIRLKYRRSYLGIIWSLLEPLLTTVVIVVIFGTLFNRDDPHFPLYVLCGRLIYGFFSAATRGACRSVRANASMIKKVYVPKYLYPLSNVLFNFIISGISLIILIPVTIYCRVLPDWHIWLVLWSVFVALIFTIGTGLILSVLDVFFRDVEYLWGVVLTLISYMSAIMYPVDRLVKSGYFWILKYNPIYCMIDIFRGGMLGYTPSLWEMFFPLVLGLLLLAAGFYVFKKKQDEFILHL